MNTCLNCKFEPEWGKRNAGRFPNRKGECQWPEELEDMPSCYKLAIRVIIKYDDGSGVERNCPTWQKK